MKTAKNLAERDALQDIVLAVALSDGSWLCYESSDTLPPQYRYSVAETLRVMFLGFDEALQNHYDTEARKKQYRDMDRVFAYAGFTNPWQEEARIYAEWVARCNVIYYDMVAKVKSNTRGLPTIPTFIAELPLMAWPE